MQHIVRGTDELLSFAREDTRIVSVNGPPAPRRCCASTAATSSRSLKSASTDNRERFWSSHERLTDMSRSGIAESAVPSLGNSPYSQFEGHARSPAQSVRRSTYKGQASFIYL